MVVVNNTWGGRLGQLATVERVTPSGRAVVGSYQYLPDGRCVGYRWRLRIATPEDIEADALRQRIAAVEAGLMALYRGALTAEDVADMEGVLERIRGRRC